MKFLVNKNSSEDCNSRLVTTVEMSETTAIEPTGYDQVRIEASTIFRNFATLSYPNYY